MTHLHPRETLDRIDELLEARYRSADLGNLDEPLAETIYILLSQQTRETVYRQVFSDLRRAYRTWSGLRVAPLPALEAILRPAGFQRRRAAQLKSLLNAIAAENHRRKIGPYAQPRQDLTLEFLRRMPDSSAEEFLAALPGIGPKTARCVLVYALGRQSFPVDTHVHRIFTRLGLTRSRGRKADHDPFQDVVPPEMRKRLHINLVHHGRAICRSTAERCGDCVLISFCARGQSDAQSRRKDSRPVAIDLFAGAGGLGSGFRSEDYRVGLALESDRHAAQTYRLNNPGVPVFEARIGARTKASTIAKLIPSLQKVDLVLAGPPCQGYSVAGPRQKNDPRNLLYRHVIRLAKELRARLVVIENVPGIRRVGGIGYVRRIQSALERAGYAASHYVLRASDFGVPQRRTRYFFIGRRGLKSVLPPAPAPTHSPPGSRTPGGAAAVTPTLMRVLSSLPRLRAGVIAERLPKRGLLFLNMSTMSHSARVKRKIASIGPGEGPISYRRLEAKQAQTLIAGHRALPVHPTLDRTISVREAARIQGFPDDYFFCGPRAAQPLQVANAVPPPVAAAVARALRDAATGRSLS